MGLGLRERLRAGVGTADEWLRDREEDLARGAAELEAKGHLLYGDAIRRGAPVVARTASELRDFARAATGAPQPKRVAPPRTVRQAKAPTVHPQQGPTRAARRDETTQGIANSPAVRFVAGDVARTAGNVAGLVTGTMQAAEDLKDGGALALRLLNPLDGTLNTTGDAGWDQVASAANGLFQRGKAAVRDPRTFVRDVAAKGRQMRRELDPTATPAKPSVAAEMRRNFDVGRNQGELLVDVGGLALGAAELKAVSTVARMSKAERVAKHLEQGFSIAKAEHLAEPYSGRGHHAIIPERARLPAWAGGGPVPRSILDSPFNVLKPDGISRGEFYSLHSKVDPFFYGTGFPRRMGPGGWSSKVLGIQKYGQPGRVWRGTPGPTKAVIGGAAVEAGGALNEALFGDEGWQ